MRLLPRDRRTAMYAVYAFCREVDDVADEGGTVPERLSGLDRWSAAIADLYADRTPTMPLAGLREAIRRFELRREDFDAIIAGMAMDVRGQTVKPREAELDLYCDRVASAPGRLSTRVFGLPDETGIPLADRLGRALQLTNILRDLDEDAAMDRLYLPRERLTDAGLADLPIADILADPRLDGVCRTLASRAVEHFAEATRIMDACPRDRVRAPRLMAAAYRPLLEGLMARGWAPPRRKVAKRKLAIAGAVLRYGFL
ncbi:presqualene diphosphate synthase HpnD [Aureimonas leprariae]|uniref:Presqualene diphosphate synthase HpnD n=2 Tax=Plantimonas leprariae TaxID=2615207 RepID=A0A7V7PR72_9HYPH|nr:presqualene diphosphate synthase HpnD [Aureimonas leprariae]